MSIELIYRKLILELMTGDVMTITEVGRFYVRYEDIDPETGELPFRIVGSQIEANIMGTWLPLLPVCLARYTDVPPAPCPPPEPPVDPDDTKPIVIPPRPKRARRMAIHQRAYWQSWQEHYRNIEAVVEEGISRGHFAKVTRPDGKIGIMLTEAGYEWMEEQEL